jgi:hypothetical protein
LQRTSAFVEVLGIGLIGLSLGSIAAMFMANEGSFIRDALCKANVCFYSDSPQFWNKLVYDFAAGCLISVVFFWLLVRWPEHRKRRRIKKSFRAQYQAFKIACIENFLAVADGGFAADLPEKLMTLEAFRDYFKQDLGDRNRWDEVANNMNAYYLQATLSRMEALRQEISFVMHNTDIGDEKVAEFLKRLSRAILMQRDATTDYDSMKSFLSFFWSLFAGWDWATGYRTGDFVEEMIESI